MPAPRASSLVKVAAVLLLLAACGAGDRASEPFDAFWSHFREAVVRNAESDVRDLTRFPFMYESRERTAAEFDTVYAALFDEKARTCIGTAAPVEEDGGYMVFCDAIIFVFARDETGWRFTEFAADPEAIMESGS